VDSLKRQTFAATPAEPGGLPCRARAQILVSVRAGILADTVNLAAGAMIFGGSVTHGLQMIVSGLLGERAFSGPANTAVLGAGLHYAISIVAAAL
jgi:hypothetical protein